MIDTRGLITCEGLTATSEKISGQTGFLFTCTLTEDNLYCVKDRSIRALGEKLNDKRPTDLYIEIRTLHLNGETKQAEL